MFQQCNVAVADVSTDHGIARHLQREGILRGLEPQEFQADGNALARNLRPCVAEPGGNESEQRNSFPRSARVKAVWCTVCPDSTTLRLSSRPLGQTPRLSSSLSGGCQFFSRE